ncbi:MAG: AmmeMemoRadiSam system protein B [Methanomicrobiales archaeon]|jgi:AmmeMemoRadiSam system protein B|nr:AmmeMemoRadiSam system protein B [Methanomicrobiales archaeon]
MTVRPCAYAGSFYPADPASLLRMLEYFFSHDNEYKSIEKRKGKEREKTESTPDIFAQAPQDNQDKDNLDKSVYGIVSPHAGYIYSGQTAAIGFCALGKSKKKPDPEFKGTIIIIGPGHKTPHSAVSACEWETPLGNIRSDTQLASMISQRSGIPIHETVHQHEHGIEVLLPFVKYRFPHACIVAIQLGDQRLEPSMALGEVIASCITDAEKKLGEDVYIVASSDGSHYISHTEAKKNDLYALSKLSKLDCYEFYDHAKHTSMCGYGPTIAMVTAAKACGAKQGVCLAYTTSGDVTGDHAHVVGYAALAVI